MAPAGRVAAVNGLAAAASMDAMVSIARKGVRRLFMLLIYGSLTMRGKMMLSRPDIHDNIAIYLPRFFFGSGKLVAVVIGNPDFGSGVDWNFYAYLKALSGTFPVVSIRWEDVRLGKELACTLKYE